MTQVYFKKTIQNGNRLLQDSRALSKQGRYLSATGHAVLAMEELGKALIEKWGVRNLASKRKSPSHVEKQGAVFVLLTASEFRSKSAQEIEQIFEADKRMRTFGPYSNQLLWAKNGFYHDIRMAATYSDKEPKIPEDIMNTIGEGFVDDLHNYYRKALSLSKYKKTMQLAAIIYQNDLGSM